MYRLHKHMHQIRKVDVVNPAISHLYLWFDTYEDAKKHCVERAKEKIVQLEKELAAEKRHLAKAQNLKPTN